MELLAIAICATIIGLFIGAFGLVVSVVLYSMFWKDEEENDKSNSNISDTETIRFKEI